MILGFNLFYDQSSGGTVLVVDPVLSQTATTFDVLGQALSVTVSWIDQQGFAESVTSPASARHSAPERPRCICSTSPSTTSAAS